MWQAALLTYGELQAHADALVSRLSASICPRTRTGLLGRGSAAWVVGLLAATRLGAEVVLMNSLHSAGEWAQQISDLGLELVLHMPEHTCALHEQPHRAALV